MLLIGNLSDSVDVYHYKLILAALCSKAGLGREFEDLVSIGYPELERSYREFHKREPKSFIDVFHHYLYVTRKYAGARNLIHASFDKLFSMDVNDIMPELLDTRHMDRKVFEMLNRELARQLTDADWQHLKTDVYKVLKRDVKLTAKFCGDGSSLFGMILHTLKFYVKKHKADLFSFLNKTGMYAVDENEFSLSMLNIEVLSMGDKYDINFPQMLKAIYRLNTILYVHSLANTDKFYFYDVLSHYKYPLLEQYYRRIGNIFRNVFKGKESSYLTIVEEKRLLNTGIKEKFQKFGDLLRILDPIVKRGLNPDDVDGYVEKIYHHVLNTQSSSSANLFTINNVPRHGNYGTETAFTKMEGHEIIKEVLEGVMALHHLFMYLSANNLNIFDLESEVFMSERFMYRFETVEEVIKMFPHTKALMGREENPTLAEQCERNRLPLNDDVISSVGIVERLESSIAFVDIRGTMGDLSESGKGRRERGRNKSNPIYNKFVSTLVEMIISRERLENLTARAKFGTKTVAIPYVRFIQNLSHQMDMVSALEIEAFQRAGVKADLACIVNPNTGYYEIPQEPFAHYCMNNSEVIALSNSLRSQSLENPDTILEVYRVCSFFMSMWEMFQMVENDLSAIHKKFDVITKVPMGFFDAYSFASKYQLVCSLRSMDEKKAIKQITEYMGTELFITDRIKIEIVFEQFVKVYRTFLSQFKSSLELLEEISDMYYTDFANKLGGGYSLAGDESFFEGAKKAVVLEHFVNTSPGFLEFARGCSKTLKGFLKRNGRLVSEVFDGQRMFLSERGVWVGRSDGVFTMKPADDSYFTRGAGYGR